ncbi:MAG: D-alanyl-D-alanine carboxypeptidase [Actinomycetaceae bacterium]|nr:D-alanyl-D-alanine carboxypeptidase [Actinomycetaceae bacterium]MDY5853993.1 D-alanyl-D-alanine carboxypeptidase [Arcanobacterium sp.]
MRQKNTDDKTHKRPFMRVFIAFVVLIFIGGFGWYAAQPEHFRDLKNAFHSWQYQHSTAKDGFFNAKSLLVVDRSTDEPFISKAENEHQRPASLAKLFTVEYARTIAPDDAQVHVSEGALNRLKENSSVASLAAGEIYSLHDLFAAMLIPSGNDAAYVVADYIGGVSHPDASSTDERIELFLSDLNSHIQQRGWDETSIHDPSGYDDDSHTTAQNVLDVCKLLLEEPWFTDIISQVYYTATPLNGTAKTWHNTNKFLDPESNFYNEKVHGVKTGSLGDDYNLVVLYRTDTAECLIVSIGSESDTSRYDDVSYLLKTIDESHYLNS